MKNDIHQMMKEGKISSNTLNRVTIAKSYIEKKYKIKKIEEEEKKRGIIILITHNTYYISICRLGAV